MIQAQTNTDAHKKTSTNVGLLPSLELFQKDILPVHVQRYLNQYRNLLNVLNAFPDENHWPFKEPRPSAESRKRILESYLTLAGYPFFLSNNNQQA